MVKAWRGGVRGGGAGEDATGDAVRAAGDERTHGGDVLVEIFVLRDGGAARRRGGETEDESLAAQMRMLRLRVPRYFHPNGVAARATNARADEQTDDAAGDGGFRARVALGGGDGGRSGEPIAVVRDRDDGPCTGELGDGALGAVEDDVPAFDDGTREDDESTLETRCTNARLISSARSFPWTISTTFDEGDFSA